MHRYLRRSSTSQFALLFFTAAAIQFAIGCGGFVYPPPTMPEAVQKEVFHVSDPIALLTFEPGRTQGHIIGELHEWPIHDSEGIPTRNFTYVGQFTVTTKSDEDGMPAGAEGIRKVYFHDEMPQLNFADAHGYGTGQEVASDAISMSFTFRENHKRIAVRIVSQQKSAHPFKYKDREIQPPRDRETADTLQGEYSPDFGGYVLRSLNE